MMHSPRLGLFVAFSVVAAACGGKIDDGTDSGVDSGTDSPSPPPACKPLGGSCNVTSDCCDSTCVGGVCTAAPPCTPDYVTCSTSSKCCSQICDATGYCAPSSPPPPPCEPDGAPCGSSSQCCSQLCGGGYCGGVQPPQCQPDGYACVSAGECCSNVCNNFCGAASLDGGPGCAPASTKLCDQCVALSCCAPWQTCIGTYGCGTWLACVINCQQKGYSAFWCTQNACGAPSTSEESALYACAQQFCSTQCTKD
ncbi:MAG TPA: hypothetical protein VLM85_04720 [Polyangiaceae bacterium]|nr:hypothetical protein [Polyangiaceae bacterium]